MVSVEKEEQLCFSISNSVASNAASKSEHLQAASREASSTAQMEEGRGDTLGRIQGAPTPRLLLTAKAGEG